MRTKACIVRRGDNWAVKQPLPEGRYHWKTVGPRKRDAEIVRDEINRRVALGMLYPSEPQTFAEFVEGWLERYAQRVRPATLASCRDSLRRLAPFDGWQLEMIRAADVEDHVFAVARQAPRAAELMLDTLKMILRSAKERGQTIDEAILRARPPRRERAEMRFLNWTQADELASETVEPYGNLVRFACLTGLRQGELFALRDRALDLERRSVLVGRERARTSSSRPRRPPADGSSAFPARLSGSSASNSLPAPERPRPRLPDSERQRLAQGQLHGAGLPASCPAGAPRPLRFHDLRHTYAALMVAAGAHPKLLQAQLGHTSINVTLNTYGHLFPDAFADVGEALDLLVRHADARVS